MSAVRLHVVHDTVYAYGSRVEGGYHAAHLAPLATPRQEVLDSAIDIAPRPSHTASTRDAFGNLLTTFALYAPHDTLKVRAVSTVRLQPRAEPLERAASTPWEAVAALCRYRLGAPFVPAVEFVFASPLVPPLADLRGYALECFTPGTPVLAGAHALMLRIHKDFRYESGVTEVTTPLAEVFRERHGVCQDFAHVMIGAMRMLGLSARYVSGYLLNRPPPGQPRLLGADASHAWVQAWCPRLGWLDLDPTNAVLPDTEHVTLAIGRDFGDVVPLRGVIRGSGEHELKVAVSVVPED
jgi:transglutaminase-like putative cysteine protease